MKKIICLISLIAAFATSTKAQQEKPKVNPEMKRFVYQANSSITKRTYDSIYFDIAYNPGNKWVFKYSYKAQDVEMIADDEYFESYEFEMAPPKGNSFTIEGDDFIKNKVIFNRGCFCLDAGLRQLEEGKIIGKKTGKNTWLVTFDLMIAPKPGTKGNATPKKFKGYFKLGNLTY
jgi:hypothetical protein